MVTMIAPPATSSHTHDQYADLSQINTFSKEQRIDVGIGSSSTAILRLMSGSSLNNRSWSLVSGASGIFSVRASHDDNTNVISYFNIFRGGGTQLLFNGTVMLETTGNGLKFYNLPTASAGLPIGHLWRDNNGFLRIV